MRSSASSDRTQSCAASEAAKFFCATYPGHGRTTTRSVTWRASEMALRLKHEEADLDAGGNFLFFRLEPAFRELPEGSRAVDALLVGLHLAPGVAHLRCHLHLEILQPRLFLRVLNSRLREVG